jgi:hypothetical protein
MDTIEKECCAQLPGESCKAYDAAKMYFQMKAQRSLQRVAQRQKKSIGLMKRWSGRYRWMARASAYDGWCERKELAMLEEELRQAARERAEAIVHRPDRMSGYGYFRR